MDEIITVNPDPTVLVDGSVDGLILDMEGAAVFGATVRTGSNMVISDENGFFSFKNIPLNEKGALVTAEKDGYFYNAKFVFPNLNKKSLTKFKMMQKTLTSSFSSNSGGTSMMSGDAKVTIPANSIKQENGALYSGTVNVYATWLDPTGENLLYEMPGDLRAQNSDGEQVQLMTYGMIGVELEDANGAPLNIADGQTATIELPVPAALLSSAPSTIPLWHFNETSGIWEEEGEATLQNGVYVGTVGHFSFWNVDVPFEAVTLTGSVTNQGKGVPNILVQITNDDNGTVGTAFTNEDGIFSGFVPANATLTITLLNACNEVLYTAQIGPFAEDTTIDPIELTNEELNSLLIVGTLQDCDFSGVSDSYIRIAYNGFFSVIPTNTNGEFNGLVSICSATEVTLIGYDLANFKESPAQTFDVTNLSTLDAGILTACEEIEDFYIATIGSQTWEYDSADILTAFDPNQGYEVFAGYNNPSTIGAFVNLVRIDSTAEINTIITPSNVTVSTDDYLGICNDVGCIDVEVILQSFEYSTPGGIVQGSYSGTIEDPTSGEMKEISGSFRKTTE